MNLNALSSRTMLVHSSAWLHTPEVRHALAGHPLGAAMLDQMQVAHDRLAAKQNMRDELTAEIARLTSEADAKDQRHDRKARAIHAILQGLVEGTDHASQAHIYQSLQRRLLPDGLSVVRRSYLDQAGAVIELKQRVTPEVLAQLAAIPVGPLTLADLYQDWVEAGEALGRTVRARAALQAAIGRDGTLSGDIDSRAARNRWIRTTSMLIHTLDLIAAPEVLREKILAPLARSIQEATRNRGGGNAGDDTGAALPERPEDQVEGRPVEDIDEGEIEAALAEAGTVVSLADARGSERDHAREEELERVALAATTLPLTGVVPGADRDLGA